MSSGSASGGRTPSRTPEWGTITGSLLGFVEKYCRVALNMKLASLAGPMGALRKLSKRRRESIRRGRAKESSKSKGQAWQRPCHDLERNHCGKAYQLAMKRFSGQREQPKD
ncbi:hypothetical protein GWI33_012210 [Rhynchophorus ferrugineus]|uniref:Uncharacterized protein n=1 Tax=Rhynchophorus ferrugineus TaxID=354439 RepID=A0A834I9R0_RHYFE|nr:hypothetical protein GWI33_012210 [Rhynchophorus ferrugineus]